MSQYQEIKTGIAIPLGALSGMEEFEASFPDISSEPAADLPVAPAQAAAAPGASTEVTSTMTKDEDAAAEFRFAPDGARWKEKLKINDRTRDYAGEATNVALIVRNDHRFMTNDGPAFGINLMTNTIGLMHGVKFGIDWVADLDMDKDAGGLGDFWASKLLTFFQTSVEDGGYGMSIRVTEIKAGIESAAAKHPFHPVRDMLLKLAPTWDREGRIEHLWGWLGAEDTPYHRETARITLLAGVCRACLPGCQWDYLPVLEGKTGLGKGSWINILAMDFLGTLDKGELKDTKHAIEVMKTSWLIEMPELAALQGMSDEEVKAILTGRVKAGRLAFRDDPRKFRRGCFFFGNTEKRSYLSDPQSNRRFWPIACLGTTFDRKAFRRAVPQIWAEAACEYLAERFKKVEEYYDEHIMKADPEIDCVEFRRRAADEEGSFEDLIAEAGHDLDFAAIRAAALAEAEDDHPYLDLSPEPKKVAEELQSTRQIDTEDTTNRSRIEWHIASQIFEPTAEQLKGGKPPRHFTLVTVGDTTVLARTTFCLPLLAIGALKITPENGKTGTKEVAAIVRNLSWMEPTGKPEKFEDYDPPAKSYRVRTDDPAYLALVKGVIAGEV